MEIDNLEIIYAARNIFPQSSKAEIINKGYSHSNYIIKTESYPPKVILRVQNSESKTTDLEKEKRVYELLNEKGIPAPRIIHLDKTKKRLEKDFMIESFADGIDLEEVWPRLTKKEKNEISTQIGEIMGRIHQIKFEEFGYLTRNGIKKKKTFSFKKITNESEEDNKAELEIIATTFENIGHLILKDQVSDEDKNQIINYIIKNKELARSKEKPSLVHGDLHIDHFRVKKIKNKWIICCLLDVELAASMQREYDFIKLHRAGFFKNKELKEALLKGYKKYQSLPKEFDKKIKFLRITRDIAFLNLLLDCGNQEKAKEVLNYILREIKK